jgi:hypothetical protein
VSDREVDDRAPYIGWAAVAKALSISERTAKKLPSRGLKVARDGFGRVLVHQQWLEDWMCERTHIID